ncbi:MAG: hypothetical protein PHN57_05275, partial [Candidatus Omnitrophica bacterium]|nr:hypothetical protein [Candidatus Omnitrophota bacterium]
MYTKIKNSKAYFGFIIAVCGLLSGIFFSPPDAQAVQIKRVQSGYCYFDIDDMQASVPIQAVDQDKSLILVYPNVDPNASNFIYNSIFTGSFESDTSLTIARDYGNTSCSVRYYIVEFNDGVFVQRGFSSLVYGPTSNPSCVTKNVTLPTSVNTANAFALVQTRWYYAGSGYDESSLVTGTLTDGSTLQLQRASSYEYNRILNIGWQVVEFQTDAEVRTKETIVPETSPSVTDTIPGTAIPTTQLNKCLLLFNSRSETSVVGVEGRYALAGALEDNGSGNLRVRFTHGYTEGAGTNLKNYARWYVVYFKDQSTNVQNGNLPMASGTDFTSAALNPAPDFTKSFPYISVSGPNSATATYEDEIKPSVDLNSIKGICYAPTATPAVWVTKEFENKVYQYNANTGALMGSYATGSRPIAVCYDSQNTAIWVANRDSDNVTKLNANTGALVGTYGLNGATQPWDVVFESSSNSVWTANFGTGNVTKITAATGAWVANYTGGTGSPSTICYDPSQGRVWAAYWTGTNSNRIYWWNCVTPATSGNVNLGTGTARNFTRIRYVDLTGRGLWPALFICNLRDNSLIRVRASTGGTATYYPDLLPQSVAFDGTNIWTVHYGTSTLCEIDPTNGNVLARWTNIANPANSPDSNPYDIVFGNSALWVSNASSLTLQKFDTSGTLLARYYIPTSASKICFSRSNTGAAININWTVADLSPLTVKTPNGGDVWHIGDTGDDVTRGKITWKHADSLQGKTVDIKLSYDSGANFPLTIASAVDATADSYSWNTIPDTLSTVNLLRNSLRVRLIVSGTTTTDNQYDDSNADFEIKGTVTVTQPNGSDIWYVGDTDKLIKWNKTGNYDTALNPAFGFSIKLSEDGGTSYGYQVVSGLLQSDVCSGNSCQWTWEDPSPTVAGIPDKIGNDRRIKVYVSTDEANVHDESDANFYIKGKLQLTVPNTGSEQWLTQNTYTIKWKKWGTFTNVNLKYSLDNGVNYYSYIPDPAGTPTNLPAGACVDGSECGSYDWTIPTAAIGDTVKIKVISVQSADLQVEDASDNSFRIVPSLKLTSPAGSSVWTASEEADITWEVYGAMSLVDLWWSKDGNAPWTRKIG